MKVVLDDMAVALTGTGATAAVIVAPVLCSVAVVVVEVATGGCAGEDILDWSVNI